jgi:hypothetical protein
MFGVGISTERNMIHSRGREHRLYDNAGHLDAEHAERLLAGSGDRRSKPPEAFVASHKGHNDLATELAEGAVVAMTSGEDHLGEDLNHDVEEDWGGPFVVTSGSKEFAHGVDESNIAEATREPFPTT